MTPTIKHPQSPPRGALAAMTGPRPLLALTLHRPWPDLIGPGIKKVENRTWHPEPRLQAGEWFCIHTGKKWDDRCIPMAQERGVPLSLFEKPLPAGHITAVALYAGHTSASTDPWFFGPEGWILEDVQAIEPIACKGAQGLWRCPDDIADKVREAFRRARKAR